MPIAIINPKGSMKKSPKKPVMKREELLKKIDDTRPSKRTPEQVKIIDEEYTRKSKLYDSIWNPKKK